MKVKIEVGPAHRALPVAIWVLTAALVAPTAARGEESKPLTVDIDLSSGDIGYALVDLNSLTRVDLSKGVPKGHTLYIDLPKRRIDGAVFSRVGGVGEKQGRLEGSDLVEGLAYKLRVKDEGGDFYYDMTIKKYVPAAQKGRRWTGRLTVVLTRAGREELSPERKAQAERKAAKKAAKAFCQDKCNPANEACEMDAQKTLGRCQYNVPSKACEKVEECRKTLGACYNECKAAALKDVPTP